MNAFTIRPILYTSALLLLTACTGIVEAPDEGAGSSTSVAICSSNVYWKDMDKGSDLMHPGGKCNNCHDKTATAPNFTVAGTVYPTLHEPDECNGVGGAMSEAGVADYAIVITDLAGRTLPPIAVNSVGNFKWEREIVVPFNVKVVSKTGKVNKMMMQVSNGDCNSCHTQTGAENAPGRIVAP